LQKAFLCPKCGSTVPVGQRFCSACGQIFEYRCLNCGDAVESLSGFCTNCGGQLQQTQPPTKPVSKEAIVTRREEKIRQATVIAQTVGNVGRYLILLAIIIFTVTILYVIGIGQQGGKSNWVGSSFIFGGQSPPSTPPPSTPPTSTPPNIDIEQEPQPDPDLPKYTTEQVITEAKKNSPHCRLSTRRTG